MIIVKLVLLLLLFVCLFVVLFVCLFCCCLFVCSVAVLIFLLVLTNGFGLQETCLTVFLLKPLRFFDSEFNESGEEQKLV